MAQKKSLSPIARDSKQPIMPHRHLNQRNLIIGFVIICLLALGIFVIRTSLRSTIVDSGRADVTSARLIARGKQIYATRCASCHASDLQGEQGWPQRRPNGVMPAPPLDERGLAWRRNDQWLFATVKLGGRATASPEDTSFMPGFGGGLTDAEIWAVISYIKSTWPQHIQDAQPHE